MRTSDIARLIVLAAIWGSSFVFMRILAPVLGPVATADIRVLLAGAVLVAGFAAAGHRVEWKKHWRRYAVIGIVNSAVPFLLFSYAALHVPASYSAILNATAPLFGMAMAVLWLEERPSSANVAGALLGMAGVGLVTGWGPAAASPRMLLAAGACLGAAACYALAGVYMRRKGAGLNPISVAGASQLVAGLLLLPAALISPPRGAVTPVIAGCALALALVCSAAAYVLYYRLIADCGPVKALTVTFLIPVFGLAWGTLFLGEAISAGMLAGCGLVIAGTALVLRRPSPARPYTPATRSASDPRAASA